MKITSYEKWRCDTRALTLDTRHQAELAWKLFQTYDSGMGRFALSLLLIANLLVCPLRCLSCQTGVVVDGDCAQAACCCQDAQDGDESSNGQPSPGGDCSCPNCICEGATVQADPEIREASDCVASGAWILSTDYLLPSGSRVDARDRPPSYPGGRDALVAYQSWLI
ncbi:MAG: hypothetical protein R3E01_33285 [Pirellulaceae bacterium]